MLVIPATHLKNRLGEVLARARLGPVAISRHGKVVAHLTPVQARATPARSAKTARRHPLSRVEENRLVRLCASGDFRPSRWLRAGDHDLLAGLATMLASQPEFDRLRLLLLAERLSPGMTRPEVFGRWLERTPLKAARLMPLIRAELRDPAKNRGA